MDVDIPISPEPKKRGWPKGKARGPRKPAPISSPAIDPPPAPTPAPPVYDQPPPPAAADPETEVELCAVKVVTNTGQSYSLGCSAFSSNATGYEFVSFPRRRGYKVLTLLKADQIAILAIEAPEQFFQTLRPVAAPPPLTYTQQPLHAVPMETGTPVVTVNPLAQRIKDEKANVAKAAKDEYGRPSAEIVDDKGNRSVVGAAMVRM
jgi:hypothetical protein